MTSEWFNHSNSLHCSPMMTLIAVYAFMAIATTIAIYQGESSAELVASFVIGFTWPLFLVVKIIQKIAR